MKIINSAISDTADTNRYSKRISFALSDIMFGLLLKSKPDGSSID